MAQPKRLLRRRFLAVGVPGLAVLGAVMGVSFLGDTGTTSVSVSPSSSSSFVYSVTSSGLTPSGPTAVTSLEYTSSPSTAGTLPSWTPTPDTAGSVTTAGDVALVDATSSALVVNIYITNLASLQSAYSSFAFPVEIYSSTCSSSTCTWALDTNLTPESSGQPTVFITNTEGQLSFSLPLTSPGSYYDITLGPANTGSYYTLSSVSSSNDSPSFYVTAQAV